MISYNVRFGTETPSCPCQPCANQSVYHKSAISTVNPQVLLVKSCYPLVNIQKNDGKSPSLMGKSTINGSCSIAMLVYKRVMGEHNGMFTIYQLLQEFPYHGSSLLHCCNPPKKDEDNLSFVRHV